MNGSDDEAHIVSADLLLIDLDGTLVDSSASITRAWIAWCQRHAIDENLVFSISEGRQGGDVIARVAPHLDSVVEDHWMIDAQLHDTGDTAEIPGARRFLSRLDPSAWAIVTSCPRELAFARLQSVGLPLPSLLVTAEDVSHGKPAPDGYQFAAQTLGVAPERCIVFEDSTAGIEAGQRAGMRVIAVVGAARHATTQAGIAVNDWRAVELLDTRPMRLRIIKEHTM